MAPSPVTILSRCTIYPDQPSTMADLKLSVSDLPMLSCHYIQKGLFFPPPPAETPTCSLLKSSLSRALSFFPPLAGRLSTDTDGTISISSNDAGVDFALASAPSLSLRTLLPTSSISDVPIAVKSLFLMDAAVSFQGHFRPLAAFQVTVLGDGAIFLGCTVNHSVVDGTSFWNFFNAWAELSRSAFSTADTLPTSLSRTPNFRRNFFGDSRAIIRFADDGRGPEVTFDASAPLRERIFHFSRDAIAELKSLANNNNNYKSGGADEVSSFQSLSAQLWRSVTRARTQLAADAGTTFRMAVNCRQRVSPRVDPLYFGNAIQSIPTTATVQVVRERDIVWTARLLHDGVVGHDDTSVRKRVAEWEASPRCFPLGNPDGAGLTMGSSPRFPMYERNDFGWGEPVAVRSGRANKFDGKISAFPAREGDGSVELEVCLAPETMARLIDDEEFMHYVSSSA